LKQIIFKWCSDDFLPNKIYKITDGLLGESRVDGYLIYSIKFDFNVSDFRTIISEDDNIIISEDNTKHFRYFKIQKILHKIRGEKYENHSLDKLSTFLAFYYENQSIINIVEQI
jgi:hypothetical protein